MVVDSSMGREACTTLQDKPHSRSGGGPQEGQRELSPQKTPEESLGVGPSDGKHLSDGNGYPTHAGVLRGGGTALASPRPLPQQRVAATPQLGAATDSSPKGVESTTTLALAIECSDVPEQTNDRHHDTEPGSGKGIDPPRRASVHAEVSGSTKATGIDEDAAIAAVVAADGRQRPTDDGPVAAAKRPRLWASGGGAGAARHHELPGERSGRALLVARLREHPRPRYPEHHRRAAGHDVRGADRRPMRELHDQRQGPSALPPRQCGETNGTGDGKNSSGVCDSRDHISCSGNMNGSDNGSASRGGGRR